MDSCDTHIVEVMNFIAHHLSRNHRFFGNGNIAGSSRNYSDHALPIFRRILLQYNRAREFAIFHSTNFFLHRGKLLVVGASGQNVAAVFRQARENSCDLRRSLPFPENHFRHSRAQRTMMIDLGKSEIFEWQVAKTINGLVGSDRAFADLVKELSDGFGVQVALALALSYQPSKPGLAVTEF